ncbi:hypothetical protein [Allocoleopsis sp.]
MSEVSSQGCIGLNLPHLGVNGQQREQLYRSQADIFNELAEK